MKHFVTMLLGVCVASTALADRVFVDGPNASLPPGITVSAIVGLVSTSARSLGHEVVMERGSAQYLLRPSVIQLGSAYLMQLDKLEGSKVLFSTQLKAHALEELDEVTHRVVRATLLGRKANEDAHVSDVTVNEVDEGTRRKAARNGSVVGVGVSFLGHLHASGPGYYLTLGQGWGLGPLTIGILWDFAVDFGRYVNTALFTDVNVRLTYHPFDRDVSPFVSGEFGFGLARDARDRAWGGGFAVGGLTGLALFRTYAVHLELALHGAALLNTSFPETPLLGAFQLNLSF